MRIRWRGLELPTRVVSDQAVSTPTYGRFSVEPFERGFGIEQVKVGDGSRLKRDCSKVEGLICLFYLKHALVDLFQGCKQVRFILINFCGNFP